MPIINSNYSKRGIREKYVLFVASRNSDVLNLNYLYVSFASCFYYSFHKIFHKIQPLETFDKPCALREKCIAFYPDIIKRRSSPPRSLRFHKSHYYFSLILSFSLSRDITNIISYKYLVSESGSLVAGDLRATETPEQ